MTMTKPKALRPKAPLITTNGYQALFMPKHPMAMKNGYVYVHRLVMSLVIGRDLLPEEQVHHKDENKQNNNPENLELVTDREHRLKHKKRTDLRLPGKKIHWFCALVDVVRNFLSTMVMEDLVLIEAVTTITGGRMGYKTGIQWCDSTLNLESGCSGCELWGKNPGGFMRHCYAGTLYEGTRDQKGYAGQKGWAPAFDKPTIFPERMDQAEKWSDLSYTDRVDKPWLNEMPRIIFLNDMGDGFDLLLGDNWLAPFIPRMAQTPHIYIMLTKRVQRMAEFWRGYGVVPDNVWLGTSITANDNLARAKKLEEIPARTLFLSMEPLLEHVDVGPYLGNMRWVIVGGESGRACRDMSPRWARAVRYDCEQVSVPFFMKQMGGIKDHKGRMKDLPADLQIRQMPKWEHLNWKGKTQRPAPQPAQMELI